MTTRRWVWLITWLVVGVVVACGGSSDSDPMEPLPATHTPQATPTQVLPEPAVATATPQSTRVEPVLDVPSRQPPAQLQTRPPAGPPIDDSGGFFFGSDAKWPDYLPDDIPVLEGEIDTLMVAPGSHVRMLYKNISEDDIARYLARLEQEGFHLEGIVYKVPGFPDKSEEKMKRGDFDAIDINRGDYHMRLEYGAGEASYDINTAAFLPAPERPTPTPANWQWPGDIADLAPAPEHSSLVDIVRLNPTGYHITCTREGETVVADYVDTLKSLGFTEKDQLLNEYGELVILTLGKGDATVTLHPQYTGGLVIDVRPSSP